MLYILGEKVSGDSKTYKVLLESELLDISGGELKDLISIKNLESVYLMCTGDKIPHKVSTVNLINEYGVVNRNGLSLLGINKVKYMMSEKWGFYNNCDIGSVDVYLVWSDIGRLRILDFCNIKNAHSKSDFCTYLYEWDAPIDEYRGDRGFMYLYDGMSRSDSGIVSFGSDGILSQGNEVITRLAEKMEEDGLMTIPYFDLKDKNLKESRDLCEDRIKTTRLEFLYAVNGLNSLKSKTDISMGITHLLNGGYRMNYLGDTWLIEYKSNNLYSYRD